MTKLAKLERECRKIAYAMIDAIHGEESIKNVMRMVAENEAQIEMDEEVVTAKIENASVGVWIN